MCKLNTLCSPPKRTTGRGEQETVFGPVRDAFHTSVLGPKAIENYASWSEIFLPNRKLFLLTFVLPHGRSPHYTFVYSLTLRVTLELRKRTTNTLSRLVHIHESSCFHFSFQSDRSRTNSAIAHELHTFSNVRPEA